MFGKTRQLFLCWMHEQSTLPIIEARFRAYAAKLPDLPLWH
jgi:hypothetical protein